MKDKRSALLSIVAGLASLALVVSATPITASGRATINHGQDHVSAKEFVYDQRGFRDQQ